MLDDKLNPITKRPAEIEKEAESAEGDGEDEKQEQSVIKQMDELLEQKLSPIQDRLEAVEKSRGISKQAGSDQESEEYIKIPDTLLNKVFFYWRRYIMDIRTIPVEKINPAPYNPRIDLQPDDPEYEALKQSMKRFGAVEPLVWNEKDGKPCRRSSAV